MDDETRAFLTTFRTFLNDVVHQVRLDDDGDAQPLLPVLEQHLGVPARSLLCT